MTILKKRTWMAGAALLTMAITPLHADAPAWAAKPDRELTVTMVPGNMKFDAETLRVQPGEKVKLNLKNPDDLEHNLVLIANDPKDPKGEEFAKKCLALGADGPKLAWTPDSPRVLAKSGMIAPQKNTVMYFEAPKEPGEYLYICSFPGHSAQMRGTLKVAKIKPMFKKLTYKVYEGPFRKIPDFTKLTPTKTGTADIIDVKKLIGGEDNRAIHWEGTFEVEKGGEWQFYLGSDDGARLSIDGEAVAENGGNYFFQVRKATEKLEPGSHTMRLAYFEAGGPEALSLVADMKGAEDMIFTPDITAKKGRRKPVKPIIVKPRKDDEALVFRTFLAGRTARSIAVAYPGQININWSADAMNLDQIWRGDFMNVAPQWNSRGGRTFIAGQDTVSPTGGMALQVLGSMKDSWIDFSLDSTLYGKDKGPEDARELITYGTPHPDYDFKGYDLDAKRFPTFNYRFKGVPVKDRYEPTMIDGIEALKRTMVIEGKLPNNTYLLAGANGEFSPMPHDSNYYKINN